MVLVLDDLHWAQPMLLDLVEHLVEWMRDAPILLVALARPELRDIREALTAAGPRARDVIDLAPLNADQSLDFVTRLLGDVRLPAVLSARILETSEGNPLFLGELLRMLVDEGALRRDEEGWIADADAAVVDVPPTIQALLAARIERLRDDERSVVERAAVVGKQFYKGAVADLVAAPVARAIDGHLETLRRKEIVEPDGTYWLDEPVYRFHHVLIRDAAYRSLLKEARAELHERFADWLETKAGELVGEHEEVVAFHLEQAHEYRRQLGRLDEQGLALGARAAARLHSAGRRALAREDLAAAVNLLGRALARLPEGDAQILWDLGEAQLSAGDTAETGSTVERLRGAGADVRRRARADVLAAQLANLTGSGEIAAILDSVTAAAGVLEHLGDPAGAAKAHHVTAQTLVRLGRVGAVEAALDRALAAARAAEDRRRITAVLAGAPRAALWGPSPVVRASGRCLDVVRILRMTPGNRHVEAVALRCQAVLEAMRGRTDAARDILVASRATLEELGLSLELQETAVHAGVVELLAGDPVAAERHLRAARDAYVTLGVAAGAAQARAFLGRALMEQDRDTEADSEIEAAQKHGGEDLRTTITLLGVRAEALAHGGRHEEALTLAERAVELAQPTDALADKAEASMARARVLLAAGRASDARAAAKAAQALYAQKGHTVGEERARALASGSSKAPRGPVPAATPAAAADPGLARPPERFQAEFQRRWEDGDVAAVIDMYAEDFKLVDHRALGWEPVDGRDAWASLIRSVREMSDDIRLTVAEVLACDDRVIALRATWRGAGTLGGGELEIDSGYVYALDDSGRCVGIDVYAADDREAMLARFATLGGRREAALGAGPCERLFAEHVRRFNAHDLAGVVALAGEDIGYRDHRSVSTRHARGRERYRHGVSAIFEIAPDVRLEVDELLACDDRVIALRVAYRGTSAGEGFGEFERVNHEIWVVEDGRFVATEHFDSDAITATLARFAQLTSPRRPPERFFAEYRRRNALHDADALLDLFAPDFVLVDHRAMGWTETRGREALRHTISTAFGAFVELSTDVDEVLACDEHVIALRWTMRGRGAQDVGGGETEIPLGVVAVIDDGLWVRADCYEADDDAAMVARFKELSRDSALGARPPERAYAEWKRLYEARDLAGLARLAAPAQAARASEVLDYVDLFPDQPAARVRLEALAQDPESWATLRIGLDWLHALNRRELATARACLDDRMTVVDRRPASPLGSEADVDTYFANVRSLIEIADDVRWSTNGDEELNGSVGRATLLIAGHMNSGGGWAEILLGVVWTRKGERMDRFELYPADSVPDQRDRMAQLAARPLGDSPIERLLAESHVTFNDRDFEAHVQLHADDFVVVDHRSVGWGEWHGRDGVQTLVHSALAASDDVRFDVEQVLACDGDRVIAARGAWRSAGSRTAGAWEIPIGFVTVGEDRLLVSHDFYEPGDEAAIFGRFAELTRQRPWRTFDVLYNARRLEELSGLCTEDFVMVDRRQMAWEETRGRKAIVDMCRSTLAIGPDQLSRFETLADDGADVAYLRHTFRGGGGEGEFGEFESVFDEVVLLRDNLVARLEIFDPADADAARARYEQLRS